MGLQKEIWLTTIVEGLWADNTFASRSTDHSGFVNDKTVHVPNAGAAPNVEKNRTSLPASITTRTDIDLTYQMNEFTTDPIRIPHAEQVELSYDKRESVIRETRAKLFDAVYKDLLASWVGGAAPLTAGTTVKETVKAAKLKMDKDLVPVEGRYMVLEPETYNDLLEELGDNAQVHFLSGADPVRGTLGRWMGFDFYMRDIDGTKKGFAWWDKAVSRALGEVVFFDDERNPTYYSDIFSFLVRAGGSPLRRDGKGLLAF